MIKIVLIQQKTDGVGCDYYFYLLFYHKLCNCVILKITVGGTIVCEHLLSQDNKESGKVWGSTITTLTWVKHQVTMGDMEGFILNLRGSYPFSDCTS